MKKLLITVALLGAGYYLFFRKEDNATPSDNTNRQVTMENLFTDFNGYVIRDNKGYNLLIGDGKVTLLPESSVSNMSVLPVDLDIYEQLSQTNPELIANEPQSTSRKVDEAIETPSCNRSVFA